MSLTPPEPSVLMLALGLALLIWILLRRSYRYFGRASRRSTSAVESVRRRRHPSRQALDDAPPELLRWQVEMHETARDLKAELDTKISVARQLVRMAAEQQERLQHTIARAEQLGRHRGQDTLDQLRRLGSKAIDDAGQLHDRSSLEGLPAASVASLGQVGQQRHAVGQLAEQGYGAEAIAEQLGLSVGEVEMLMSLHGRP